MLPIAFSGLVGFAKFRKFMFISNTDCQMKVFQIFLNSCFKANSWLRVGTIKVLVRCRCVCCSFYAFLLIFLSESLVLTDFLTTFIFHQAVDYGDREVTTMARPSIGRPRRLINNNNTPLKRNNSEHLPGTSSGPRDAFSTRQDEASDPGRDLDRSSIEARAHVHALENLPSASNSQVNVSLFSVHFTLGSRYPPAGYRVQPPYPVLFLVRITRSVVHTPDN